MEFPNQSWETPFYLEIDNLTINQLKIKPVKVNGNQANPISTCDQLVCERTGGKAFTRSKQAGIKVKQVVKRYKRTCCLKCGETIPSKIKAIING